jgi:hypothetical protein
VREDPVIIHHGKTRETTQGLVQHLGLHNKFYPGLDAKYRIAPRLIKHAAVDCRVKDFAPRKKFLLNLLSPYLTQAYRNAQTVTHIQQKLTLVDRALDRLHLRIIVLTPDRKVRLATESAVPQVTNYLGRQCLRGKPLAESLWRWVKQQEVALKGKTTFFCNRTPSCWRVKASAS